MLGIDFAHPGRLWLLAGLAPLAAWAARGARLRLREWGAFGQGGRPPGDGSMGRLAAMALVALALAQPRWGRSPGPEAPEGHDVVFCVDVSRSMAAEDAVPDRLGVAVGAASSLLGAIAEEPGPRSAVVAFAGRAVVRCPMTANLGAAEEALRALRAGEVQPGGTDLGAALEASAGAFDEGDPTPGRTVVVFTDGEDHAGSWPKAIDRLRAAGIFVHCVAIGDPDHAHPVPRDGSKPGSGPPAETRRADAALVAIARATGGVMVPIGLASADLGALYRDRIAPTARRRREEIRPPERSERFPAFVLAALVVGLVGPWPWPWPWPWPGRAGRSGLRLAFVLPGLIALGIGAGPGGETPRGLVEEGRAAYGLGRFAEALGAFDRAIAGDPAAAVPRFDAASALFQLRRYPEAIARYEEARDRGDPGLATKVDYALGNARLALGDVPRALVHYDACLASTWPGPASDAVRRDAAENRAYAAVRIPPPPRPEGPGGGSPKAPRPDQPRPPPGPEPQAGKDRRSPSTAPADPSKAARGGGPAPSPGAGGPGGQGEPNPDGGSPEARLDAALREIREARRHRPPDAPPVPAGGSFKDW